MDDPRIFLSNVKRWHHVVWALFVELYLTEQDITRHKSNISDQEQFAFLESLQHYRADHIEPRFFRDRTGLKWPIDTGWPIHMGPVHHQLIKFKHFKYRSPDQIATRLQTRQNNISRGFSGWEHAVAEDWRDKIVCPSECSILTPLEPLNIDKKKLPKFRGSLARQVIQHACHALRIWP